MEHDKPSIILLTETWLTPVLPDGLVNLKGYKLFRKDRLSKKGGGVCMYLADQVLSNFHVSPITFDCAAIEALFYTFSNKDVTFVLGCVYRPSSTFLGDDKVLFDFIN